jgi:hypothetical protein
VADTLAANVAESYQAIIAATQMLMPQKAVMMNLVEKITIPKGHGSVQIPRVNPSSLAGVLQPTEGDEIIATSQFDLTSTTLTPTLRVISYRVSGRAEYFSRDDVVKMVSTEISRAQGQDIDQDLLAEITNFNTANDVGSTNTDLSLATLRTAVRLLQANPVSSGGPASAPFFCVISPIANENLMTNLGLQGVVSSTSPWIPSGMSEELIRTYGIPQNHLVGVTMFWDGYMVENGSGDTLGGMFSREALQLVMSKDWDLKVYDESDWIGPIIRCVADYDSGVGKYSAWGSQITCDGA